MSIGLEATTASQLLPPPLRAPVYRLDRTFEDNAASGPSFFGAYPKVPATPLKDFFGHGVGSRFGIAASLIMNARWFELYSRLGFDLLTYKTIRSRARKAHPLPNWVYVDEATAATDEDATLQATRTLPAAPLTATAAGSIGMPSSAPEFWRRDIVECRTRLRPGQVLIVSVVGTAHADTRESELYRDVDLAARIAGAARAAAGSVPLLVKVGPTDEPESMAVLLRRLRGLVDGVVMINAPSRRIIDAAGAPAFGADRERAGMMGGATFGIALSCVRNAVAIVERERLDLRILAVGGVCSPQRIGAFFDAGAYAVLAASACAWDPYLAIRAKLHDPRF